MTRRHALHVAIVREVAETMTMTDRVLVEHGVKFQL